MSGTPWSDSTDVQTERAESESSPSWPVAVLNSREKVFGWLKSVVGFRRTRYRGLVRSQLAGYLVAAAYNLVRMARLMAIQRAAA
jgi:IS5 family transposase